MRVSIATWNLQYMIAYCNDVALLPMHLHCRYVTNGMYVENLMSMAHTFLHDLVLERSRGVYVIQRICERRSNEKRTTHKREVNGITTLGASNIIRVAISQHH